MSAPAPGFATFRITIDDGGSISRIERQFATWGVALRDLSPAWRKVGERLLADNMLNVMGEGQLYAGGWVPLRPRTIRDRVRLGYGPGPMEWRSGEMARSLSYQGAAGNVFEVRPDGVTVGSDLAKAGYQHWGTSRGVPPRSLVGVTWSTQSQLLAIIADFVREQARSAGFEVN